MGNSPEDGDRSSKRSRKSPEKKHSRRSHSKRLPSVALPGEQFRGQNLGTSSHTPPFQIAPDDASRGEKRPRGIQSAPVGDLAPSRHARFQMSPVGEQKLRSVVVSKGNEGSNTSAMVPDKVKDKERKVLRSGNASVNGDQTIVVLNPSDNAISWSQIPGIDQLSNIYKNPDIAARVYSFLNWDGKNISFPVHDTTGLTSGDTVIYGFLYLALLVMQIDTLTVKQIVQDGKWREISLILKKLRHLGFGGLYFEHLEADMSAEREIVECVAEAEAESEFMLMNSKIMQEVSKLVRESAEIEQARGMKLTEETNIAKEKYEKEQSLKKLSD